MRGSKGHTANSEQAITVTKWHINQRQSVHLITTGEVWCAIDKPVECAGQTSWNLEGYECGGLPSQNKTTNGTRSRSNNQSLKKGTTNQYWTIQISKKYINKRCREDMEPSTGHSYREQNHIPSEITNKVLRQNITHLRTREKRLKIHASCF